MNDPDLLAQFSWVVFAVAAFVYTLLVFTGPRNGAGRAFSADNAVPKPTVLGIHIAFLAIVLALTWIAATFYSSLPSWMHEMWIPGRGRSEFSDLDLAFIFALFGVGLIERKCVYKEAEPEREERV